MQNVLQAFANKFCAEFGLAPVIIEFDITFTKEEIKLYSLLTCPNEKSADIKRLKQNERKLVGLLKQKEYEAMKDLLWKEIVANPSISSFMSKFEYSDVLALKGAIDFIRTGKKPTYISQSDEEGIEMVAERIRKFHPMQ